MKWGGMFRIKIVCLLFERGHVCLRMQFLGESLNNLESGCREIDILKMSVLYSFCSCHFKSFTYNPLQQATKRETRQDKKGQGSTVLGTKFHGLLKEVFKKRGQNNIVYTQEEQQALKFVEDIEDKFQCKIICGERKINGFAIKAQTLHYWTGEFDAVGLMNKNDKNGSGVVVIDWRTTCDDVNHFWEFAEQYRKKLHQCIIYRRLLAIQMRKHFNDQEIPEPGIMIVAIDRDNIYVNVPRLCLDFTDLEKVGIFVKINEFDWKAGGNASSQNGSCQGSKLETVEVHLHFSLC